MQRSSNLFIDRSMVAILPAATIGPETPGAPPPNGRI
jgi:hypothetical protein